MELGTSPFTRPFWEGVERGELLRPVCEDCGASHFTPRPRCPACRSARLDWRRSSGDGVVYSFTVVCRKPAEGFDVPFVLALVELEEGWTMMTHVVGVDPDAVRCGQLVQVRFDSRGGVTRPVFVPRQASPTGLAA